MYRLPTYLALGSPCASSVVLRIHSKTGTVLRERQVEAACAYGHLVVGPTSIPRVAVCTSSGKPAPEGCGGYPYPYHILGYRPGYTDGSQLPAFGDTIVVWDWQQDQVTSVDLTAHARPVCLMLGSSIAKSDSRPCLSIKSHSICSHPDISLLRLVPADPVNISSLSSKFLRLNHHLLFSTRSWKASSPNTMPSR